MSENKLVDLSTEFAVKILNFTNTINGHSSLSNQLERSGTSIGANIREANYAHGKADFVAKLQISLKECFETEYWLDISRMANIVSEKERANHNQDGDDDERTESLHQRNTRRLDGCKFRTFS